MKRLLAIILIFALISGPTIALAASSIVNARYFGIIQISNNSTAETLVATTCGSSINTTNLIAGGYLNAGATNCAVRSSSGADVAFMPGYTPDGNPWCLWVPSIGDYGYQSDILYTANSTDGKIRYFPGTGGMTTPDNDATLELGDNFTVEQSGWVDTSSYETEIYKDFFVDSWADVGTGVGVNPETESLEYNVVGGDHRSSFDIGTTNISDTSWELQFTFYYDTANANALFSPAGLVETLGNPDGYSDDGIMMLTNATPEAYIRAWDEGVMDTSALMNISLDTIYYVTLERVATDNASLSIFTDFARTTHIAGSPVTVAIPATIVGLRYIQASSYTGASGTSKGWIDFSKYDLVYKGGAFKTYISGSGNITSHILGSSANVTATGVSSGEHTVKTEASEESDKWATGDVLHFDGTINSDINWGALYNSAPQFWVSFWFKLDSNLSAGDPQQNLFGKHEDANDYLFIIILGGTGELRFALQHGGGGLESDLYSTETSWTANTWYHIFASTSNINGARLRINGGTAVTDATSTPLPDSGNLVTGAREVGGGTGIIGETINVITGTADLIPDEELELYNGIAPANAVNYWYIDEGTGTAIVDYGTGGNDGTANAVGTSWETSTYSTGKSGRLCDFILQVDDDKWGVNLKGASVPDNGNNWAFLQNNVMPYMEYQKIWIDGVLRQHIVWEYGTVFTDLSENDNPATPSFRTASSDADVSAELISFQPVSEARAPDYVLGEAPAFIDPAITGNVTGTFTTTPGTGTFPLANVIAEVAAATDTPEQLPLLIIAVFCILAASLSISATMRRYGSGSLLVKIMVIASIMGIFVALGNFAIDFWMIVVFLVIAIALAFMSKQLGWS